MIKGKIEKNELTFLDYNNKMKVFATIDSTLLCGVLDFSGKKYYMDIEEFNKFARFDKKFSFINEDDKYPSYLHNYKRYSLLEFLFTYNSSNITYTFKNNNDCDLRKSNLQIYHNYHIVVVEKYKVIEYIQGHYNELGVDAYVMKNPLWRILNNEHKEELLMYCEKDTLLTLCNDSYQKILDYEKINNKRLTFYKGQNGYISSNIGLYIHQIITGCYDNERKEISVDHVDQNLLNNSYDNLQIANREEQQDNCKGIKSEIKRARKHNAKPLPESLTHEMMKKYVVYYDEYIDKEKTKHREFFKVEKHPKLHKPWITSKSNKVSLLEKLASANKVVDDLEKNIYPIGNDSGLPKFITIKLERGKPHMIFDKKEEDKRLNLRMVLPNDYALESQLDIFIKKIKTKYDITIE
jgi:hypothetical protein